MSAQGGRVPLDTEYLDLALDPEVVPIPVGERLLPDARPRVGGAVVTQFADVAAERVEWLWPGRIPAGTLTVLDGDPGLGKSTLSLDLAARVSRGSAMADGVGARAAGSVILLSAEDDLARVIRPRLDAAGADVARVFTVQLREADGLLRDPEISSADLAELEAVIVDTGARLAVVDPLMAYLPDDLNAHRDQDVRRALRALRALAERTQAAVLVIRHLNKSPGANPLYRGGGSIGIIGAARSALLVTADPDDDERRILAVNKTNLALKPPAYAYQLISVPDSDHPRVRWLGPTEHTAADLLAPAVTAGDRSALEDAKDFYRDALAGGARASAEVEAQRRTAGISESTGRRARAALSVKARRDGFGGPWVLQLSAGPDAQRRSPDPIGAQPKKVSTYGAGERLWTSSQPAGGGIDDDPMLRAFSDSELAPDDRP